jgi:ferredoxin
MQEEVVRELAALGVPRERVQVEASGVADDVTALPGWPSEISRADLFTVRTPGAREPVRAVAGEALITALERAGIRVAALCRNGVCGSCRRKLLDGSVYVDPAVAPRASDRAAGYVLLCASYPLSDISLGRL